MITFAYSKCNRKLEKGKDKLTRKLELYIRKYYDNTIIRGVILFVAVFLVLFLIISLFEHFTYSGSPVRALIFYGFLLLNGAVFVKMILLPFFRRKGWIRRMSYEEAARRIGAHFPEIGDKLLNTLQLHDMAETGATDWDLLQEAVRERTEQMKPFRFHQAIDFRKNLRYAKYAAIPLLIFLLLICTNTPLITGPTQRIVHYRQYYEKPAPYRFVWTNPTDTVFQDEDLTLKIKTEGKETPDEVFVEIDGTRYRMKKNSPIEFEYELRKLRQNTGIRFVSEEVHSQTYLLEVLPKPSMIHFSIHLSYPAYLHKIDETMDNNGNITIPEGTRLQWKFKTLHTDELLIIFNDKTVRIHGNDDSFTYQCTARSDIEYALCSNNRFISCRDSLHYSIQVIPDAYPEIQVESSNDSLYFDRFYFKGNIQDDYGFRKLQFVYFITQGKDTITSKTAVRIPLSENVTAQTFYYYFDAQTLGIGLGQTLHYCFEVWDNDGVNGSKVARTSANDFRLPSPDEVREQSEQVQEQTKDELSQLMKENEQMVKRIESLQKKMLQQKDAGWQDKKEMEKLLEQWKDLKKELQEISENQKRQQEMESQYETSSEEILKKQEELQKRLDELFSDEMKQTLSELQRMMEKDFDKEKLNQALDKIKLSTEELNKQLDQDLALFKRLEVEKKMENILKTTEELAQKQQDLANETMKKSSDEGNLLQKQQQLQNEFRQLTEDKKEMEDMNKELESPYRLPDQKELENSIRQEMEQAGEQLQKKKNSHAAEHQKKAAQEIDQMRKQMEDAFQQEQQEGLAEDMQSIRRILQHIIQASFQQEKLMKQLSGLKTSYPAFKTVLQEQFTLKENLRIIEDSISAVAHRQEAVKPFINKQISKINNAQFQIIEAIGQTQEPEYYYFQPRNFSNAAAKQQYVMTALNDLSLMLAESLDQMQNQQGEQSGSSSKGGGCKKGGKNGDKPSNDMKSLREMQQELNRQLEEMRKQQEGNSPQKNGSQSGSQSEQFARMAARQEAIRRMTQEYLSKMQKEGTDNGNLGNLQRMMREMEQTEKELVNKILNQETINRQRNITTRMLQSERAEMQKEKDDQRESRQGKEIPRTPPAEWMKQQDKQQQQTEMYKTVPPSLNYFYKQKANRYFYHFE